MKVVKKAMLVIMAFGVFSNSINADIIAVKSKASANDKNYFSQDIRRAKIAGQQQEEPEFNEQKPWPVPEVFGLLLLVGVAVAVGTFINHGGGH